MAKKFKTPELEFKFWSEKGLTPSQVMKRMSSKNLAVVAEADARQVAGDFQDNAFQVDSLKDPTRATGARDRKRPRAELTDVDVTTRSRLFPGPPDRARTSDVRRPRIDRLDLTTRSTGFPGRPDQPRPFTPKIPGPVQQRERQPARPRQTARQRQAVVERGDTYQRLAEKLGVHELDLIRENNGAELTPGTAVNIPAQLEDFRQAEAQAARTDQRDRTSTAPGRARERARFRFDEPGFVEAAVGRFGEGVKTILDWVADRDTIWKTKDGQPVTGGVEGVDWVRRTTPVDEMPAGQGSGRLAWAESRLPVGTKLDDYNPQDLLEAGIFKEAEIWWMISQGLLKLDEEADATAGGTGGVFMGAGGVKKVAKQITAGRNFGFSSGARPQTVRQMADLGLTSWSI